ncbi:MAG TPA: tRNA lysidine(34) synthetase TilS [Thermoanaerobaculia bacterium]|nr:tRNA lysidine(34) synthetase TilS [Thermoanaerobaculia bacterium]
MPSPLDPVLDQFFTECAPLAPGERLAVAFSGGPDSLALLLAADRLAERRGWTVLAIHIDHRTDEGSPSRARQAEALARSVGAPFARIDLDPSAAWEPGQSREATARRRRYRALEEERAARGASWLATAHHADDQAETVLLRLAQGSSWAGLAGSRRRAGAIVRPLLDLPRSALAAEVTASGLRPVDDPTNRDLSVRRNAVRHRLLPYLTSREPDLVGLLRRVADAAGAAGHALRRRFHEAALLPEPPLDGVRAMAPALRRELLRQLAAELVPLAGRRAAVFADLDRQLAAGAKIGCDAGGGWRWSSLDGRLRLARTAAPVPPFSYTLPLPGTLRIPQAGLTLRAAFRDGEGGEDDPGARRVRLRPERLGEVLLEIRSRRAGDRFRPEGGPGGRKLKELLIDRKIPPSDRDRLPLVCAGEAVVWIPGVALAEGWRAAPREPAWELEVSRA